jgi:hypothetical protein
LRFHAAKTVRRGRRTVLLTPNPGPRFGNFLYYWLHAAMAQSAGRDYRVQVHSHLQPWLQYLPDVRARLSVVTPELGFFDRREWPPPGQFQRYRDDFGREHLEDFVNEYLERSPLLDPDELVDQDCLVVNVRRGDYYSVPKFRRRYAYNVPGYVEAALARAVQAQPVQHIRVVSDDTLWCKQNLDKLLSPVGAKIDYGGSRPGPLGDFRTLAAARRIIATNSTFSYWGAYVSTIRHGAAAHIQVPRFMHREPANEEAPQILPGWDVMENIPGGWDTSSM